MQVTAQIHIPETELEYRFILASGPGGQKVNKVATAVQLRFDAAHSSALPETVRARLAALAGSRMTKDGELLITAKRYRTQERNRQDARDRLLALLRKAAQPPKPRRKTRLPKAARERRLQAKRQRSEKKQARRARADWSGG